MKVVRAEKMGFCFGVKVAVDKAENLGQQETEKKKYMLGMLVHNEHVIKTLEKQGIEIITEEEVIEGRSPLKKGDLVIIRAHGTIKEVWDKLKEKEVSIIDATCAFVSVIVKILRTEEEKGKEIIFLGDRYHPEVRGIISFGKDVKVISTYEDLENLKIKKNKKYILLTQTTLNKDLFKEIEKKIKLNYPNVDIFDKICGATYERQEALKKIAKEVDVMIIVGGRKSSNTKKLFNISSEINDKSYLIQDENDIRREWFQKDDLVGITAGASTPEVIINKIEDKIRGIYNE